MSSGSEVLGIEFSRLRGGDVRLRIVYPTGSVTHTVPLSSARRFSDGSRKVPAFFRGEGVRSVRLGEWAGPE